MTQPEIPQCPVDLVRKLREPASFAEAIECPPDPGTVWEARAPDGELLVFLVVRRYEPNEAAPFSFVRAIPMSDYVRLTETDDAIVAIESSATILAAHCWLEGPVLLSTLVRCIGSVSAATMDVVSNAREKACPSPINVAVAAFRESLYEQFDPVFTACWQELYIALAQPNPLGYVDELREALASPLIQLLFPFTADVGKSVHKVLTGQIGSCIDTSRGASPGDTANRLDDVRWETAAQVAYKSPELCENAHSLVSSLGFCHLYGVTLPSDVTRTLGNALPPELLVPAIVASLQMLHLTTEDARNLPQHFDAAEPLEDRSYCTSLLHLLMELWASFVVIDNEYQKHVCARQSIESPFGIWMRRLLDAFATLDDELQRDERFCLLSVATELPLLDNWRKMLVEPYREPLPWWLDGTLEMTAQQLASQVVQLQMEHAKPDRPEIVADAATSFEFALDEEYAMATTDESPITGGPTAEESRTIAYLTSNISEILQHDDSSVWFELASDGVLARHTYDETIADGYVRKSGPHAVPLFVRLDDPIEPKVQELLNWFTSQLGLRPEVAERVCKDLGLRW